MHLEEVCFSFCILGKLIKMTKGKHRYEHFILVRNIDGGGPILQCSYFDFDHNLENLTVGKYSKINC